MKSLYILSDTKNDEICCNLYVYLNISIFKNNKQIIRAHNKTKKHLNYDPNKVLDTRTYYQKHREQILSKIKTEDYKQKQKLYQQKY